MWNLPQSDINFSLLFWCLRKEIHYINWKMSSLITFWSTSFNLFKFIEKKVGITTLLSNIALNQTLIIQKKIPLFAYTMAWNITLFSQWFWRGLEVNVFSEKKSLWLSCFISPQMKLKNNVFRVSWIFER